MGTLQRVISRSCHCLRPSALRATVNGLRLYRYAALAIPIDTAEANLSNTIQHHTPHHTPLSTEPNRSTRCYSSYSWDKNHLNPIILSYAGLILGNGIYRSVVKRQRPSSQEWISETQAHQSHDCGTTSPRSPNKHINKQTMEHIPTINQAIRPRIT